IRSAGEIMGLVHPDPDRTSEPNRDLARFGAIIQSELPDDQWEQIVERGMSLPSALARALTRTREAFEHGELADLHVALEELRAQASAAAETIARLTNIARSSERPVTPDGGRCLLSVNDVVLHALSTAAAAGPVSSQLDPRLPRVAADPAQVGELLPILPHARAGRRGEPAPGRAGGTRDCPAWPQILRSSVISSRSSSTPWRACVTWVGAPARSSCGPAITAASCGASVWFACSSRTTRCRPSITCDPWPSLRSLPLRSAALSRAPRCIARPASLASTAVSSAPRRCPDAAPATRRT